MKAETADYLAKARATLANAELRIGRDLLTFPGTAYQFKARTIAPLLDTLSGLPRLR